MKTYLKVSDTVYIELKKARITKYIKRWKGKDGSWNYLYPADFKNPFSALANLFGFKKERVSKEYKDNNIKEKFDVEEKDFASHVLEYLSNRKKWDFLFSKKEKSETSVKVKKEEKTEKKVKKDDKKPVDFNKSLMKEIFNIFNKKQEAADDRERLPDRAVAIPAVSTDNAGKVRTGAGIKTARADITKKPSKDFLSENLRRTLRDHQKDFINLAMESLEKEKAIFNMDGTGAGKTLQEIGLAQTFLEKNPDKPILIVTENKRIVESAFMPDADMIGADISAVQDGKEITENKIYVTTYNRLEKFGSNKFGMVIFDESHNLKNKSKKTENGEKIIDNSDKVSLFSATPIDKGNQVGYIAKAFNLKKTPMMKSLGYKLEDQHIGRGQVIKVWKADESAEEIANRIDALFTDITKKGLAVKREVPLDNLKTQITNIKLNPEQQARYDKAEDDFYGSLDEGPLKKAVGLMSLRRLTEELKIDATVDNILNEIKANDKKQIVLFATRVNDSEVYDEESIGSLKEISKRLNEKGIDHVNVFDSSKTAKDDIAKFQTGAVRIILTTPQSGGTGLSLDDTEGDKPRKAIVMTPPFSAMEFIQMAGRINRMNTVSAAEIEMLSTDTMVDGWNKDIIANKLLTLGSAVSGDYKEIDIKELDRLQFMSAEDQRAYMQEKKAGGQKVAYSEERNIDIDNFRFNAPAQEKSGAPTQPLRNISAYESFIPKDENAEWPDAEINFGKFKGKTLSEIQKKDAGYLGWMLGNINASLKHKAGSIKFSTSMEKAFTYLRVLNKNTGKYTYRRM